MSENPRIAFYVLTHEGLAVARKLAAAFGGDIHAARRLNAEDVEPLDSLPDLVSTTFARYDGHVFVMAAGIVVRCIAPHLKRKDVDPAVVVLDQQGAFAVSLLSGHLGGANDLAVQCADILGGQAVVTTATDSAGVPSLDTLAMEKGMVIGNLSSVKVVNSALLDKKVVQIHDPGDTLEVSGSPLFRSVTPGQWRVGEPGVWVSEREDCPDDAALRLYPRTLVLGVGCRRGVSESEISTHILNVFEAANLSLHSVAALGSVDVKADEPGLLAAADRLGVTPEFFTKGRLDAVEAPNPSGTVMRRLGVASVAEAAAILLAQDGELLVEKTKTQTVTLAVARRTKC